MKSRTYLILFSIGVILRIAGMWVAPLWYDENFTLLLARMPFERMIAATVGDVHPPLWYIIEWLVYHPVMGQDAWFVRVPALVCSIIALDVFRSLMEELKLSARVQTFAFAMMAVLPMQLWYAQEGRMYSLLMLEVLAALLLTLRRNWIGLCAVSVAMLYTQNYAPFYLAVIGLVVLVRDLQARRIHDTYLTAASMLAAVCLYLPWVRVLSQQMTEISGRYWIQQQRIGDGLNILYKLFWGPSTPSWALFMTIFVTLGMLALGVVILAHERTPAKWTIYLMAFGPFVLAWIASIVWQPVLLFRPLIGTAPFLYVIVAQALAKFIEAEQPQLRREPVLVSFLLIPLLVAGVGGYYQNNPVMKMSGTVTQLSSALEYVRAHWQAGDVIYYTDDGPMINMLPYASDLPQYMIDVCGGHVSTETVLGSLSPATRAAIGIQIADLADVPHKRAWVFAPFSPLHPKCYEQQIAPYTSGMPVMVVDNNQFIYSAVWLIER